MKIALCLSGQSKNTDSRGLEIDYKMALKTHKKFIIDSNDVDVFIHTWKSDNKNHKKRLIQDYSPKKILIEEPIFPNYRIPLFRKKPNWAQQYSYETKLQALSSRWDSQKKVNQLRKDYQKQTNVEYDFIISCRFDLLYYKAFPWKLMNREHYYFSNWHANWDPKHAVPGYNDPYFISGEHLTDIYSSIFDNLHDNWNDDSDFENYICNKLNRSLEDKFSAHTIIRWQFLNEGVVGYERFVGVEHETWNLVRKSHILSNPWWKCPWDVSIPFNPNNNTKYDLQRFLKK
jgi:hypothetical protein